MTLDLAALEGYRATLRRREADAAAARAVLRDRAWQVAGLAADLLRARFAAQRVVVFGSLVDRDGVFFDARSDLDLAAWGIRDEDYFVAVAQLQDVAPELSIDLVAMERCPPYLRTTVLTSGVDV